MPKLPEASEGVPEYMISYADMLTIMLAFFVVLYASTSASGDKDKGGKAGQQAQGGKEYTGAKDNSGAQAGAREPTDDRLQPVFESLYNRFGPEWTVSNCWTGGPFRGTAQVNEGESFRPNRRPRFAQRDNYIVLSVPKPSDNIITGGRIYFDDTNATIGDEQIRQLRPVAGDLAGKLQKIEIRGHTGRRPLPPGSPYHDHWDLAYARCRAVEQWLVTHGIDPRRIRLGVAGQNEPAETDSDPVSLKQNSRVEIHLLNEWVKDPHGASAAANDQQDAKADGSKFKPEKPKADKPEPSEFKPEESKPDDSKPKPAPAAVPPASPSPDRQVSTAAPGAPPQL